MTDMSKVPVHVFDLSQLLHAKEILAEMKRLQIESYCYAFIYNTEVLKYGLQYDLKKSSHGERVYRQAFHIPGWPTKPSEKTSGNDMLDIVKLRPDIHKNDVCVKIWDMTAYPRCSSLKPNFEVDKLERELIKAHITQHGSRPIGNIKDESHMDNAVVISDSHFENLFEV